ncbi:DUF1542 domain-containing protein [Emticicia sp. TH156]|uniref:DUF1542 domain-containing protein n=1 Tax=Emticicia sp. TH156 TaxID=2067454 RepID=UPI000C7870B6|nr:DUF1542 domain-containing protein [Emticicia sp. TH156]PLK44475.1 hypothetical protein C0V77_11870 [Emticicia sp. TH156]
MAINTSIKANFITYLQNLETEVYYGGPYLMVDFAAYSVDVNGEAIKNPVFTTVLSYDTIVQISVSWQAADGNASSAALQFYFQPDSLISTGKYMAGTDALTPEDNFTGLAAEQSADLTAWNGKYNTYVGTDYKEDDTLTISSPSITYKSKAINNYVYLVQTTTLEDGTVTQNCQVSWFESGGNDQNAIIGFSISEGYLIFIGDKWNGSTQPTEYNFMGTTAPTPPSNWMTDAIIATEEAAKDVADTAVDIYNDAMNAAKDATDASKDAADEAIKATTDTAKDATDDAKDVTDEAVKATEDAAKDATDGAKDAADEAEKAAKDAADAAKDATDDAKNSADNAAKDAADASKNAIDSIFKI